MNVLITWTVGAWMAANPAAGAGSMTFSIWGIAPKGGQVGCALFFGREGYPMEADRAVQRTFSPIEDDEATCRFEGLAPGDYALSVMHDEDGDGEIDKNFFGIPTEGWATSNDAPPRAFGPPKWEDAKIDFDGGAFEQRIRMRY